MVQSMSLQNGERREFRLGYVRTEDFPFLSDCFFRSFPPATDCKMPGISGEVWTDIARELNWTLRFLKADEYGGYDPEEDGYFSGVLGMVQKGEVDGTIALASLRPSRDKYFTYTEAPQTYENGLLIGEQIATKPEIILYVFHWSVIAILGFCTICIAFYNYCACRMRRKEIPSSSMSLGDAVWDAILTVLLQDKGLKASIVNIGLGLGLTLFYLMYFAGFRSQAMIITQRRSNLLISRFFERKEAKVIIRAYSSLKPEHRMAIFGADLPDSDPRILVEEDRSKIAQIICQNPNIAHYSRLDVFLASERVPGCVFKTLALTGNVTAIGFKGTQAYVLSKNVSKPVIEKINEIIRKVYSIDQVNTYMYRKYGIREVQALATLTAASSATPISLDQIDHGFLFVIRCFLIAGVICIAERFACRQKSWHIGRRRHSICFLRNATDIRYTHGFAIDSHQTLHIRLYHHVLRMQRWQPYPRF